MSRYALSAAFFSPHGIDSQLLVYARVTRYADSFTQILVVVSLLSLVAVLALLAAIGVRTCFTIT